MPVEREGQLSIDFAAAAGGAWHSLFPDCSRDSISAPVARQQFGPNKCIEFVVTVQQMLGRIRNAECGDRSQPASQPFGMLPPPLNPIGNLGKRDSPYSGLNLSQPPIRSERLVKPAKTPWMVNGIDCLVVFAMVLIGPHSSPKISGVCGDHTAFACGRHDLVLAERECSDISQRSNRSALVSCPLRLSTVFNQEQAELLCQSADFIHLTR